MACHCKVWSTSVKKGKKKGTARMWLLWGIISRWQIFKFPVRFSKSDTTARFSHRHLNTAQVVPVEWPIKHFSYHTNQKPSNSQSRVQKNAQYVLMTHNCKLPIDLISWTALKVVCIQLLKCHTQTQCKKTFSTKLPKKAISPPQWSWLIGHTII